METPENQPNGHSEVASEDNPPSEPASVQKRFPSADLEDTIPEVVDDQQQGPVNVKQSVSVTATQSKNPQASSELIGFLNRCGIEDEAVYEAFAAFGVQSEADVSELVEEVGCATRATQN